MNLIRKSTSVLSRPAHSQQRHPESARWRNHTLPVHLIPDAREAHEAEVVVAVVVAVAVAVAVVVAIVVAVAVAVVVAVVIVRQKSIV